MRWGDYYLTQGEVPFRELWTARGNTPTLVVIGGGFDPRTARALSAVVDAAAIPVDIVLLELDPDSADEKAAEIAASTREEIERIAQSASSLTVHPYPDATGRRSAGMSVSRSFHTARYLDGHDEVIIDVSGLPRSIFFPLIESMLRLTDRGQWEGDLHVTVCDNPSVDAAILTEGAEAPVPLGGFAGAPQVSGAASTIWVPVLGEGRLEQLVAIWEDLAPDEVIPVLPFPSSDPRRGDDLLLEYREFLFDVAQVEPRNYMHASETNPFDLYRSLGLLEQRYRQALDEVGGARFVLSTHSSKLLSLGALMAAHEFQMQVQQVSPSRSGLPADASIGEMKSGGVLSDLWMLGEPYR